jgi:hypothetical protein
MDPSSFREVFASLETNDILMKIRKEVSRQNESGE